MATLNQIAQALKAADAAGDTVSAQRLAQAYRQQQTAQPQSNALSDAYRQALLSGDTVKAHQIAVQARAQNVPIAPVSDSDINQSVDQRFAQSVQNEGAGQQALEGAGKSFADTAQGLGQLVGAVSPQQVAQSRQMATPLMQTRAGQLGYGGGTAAQIVGGAALGGIAAGAPALAGLTAASPTLAGSLAGGTITGAAYGDIAPYATAGEHVANIVAGGLLGPAAAAGAKGLQLAGRGGRALVQRYTAPDTVAASRLGKLLAGEGVSPSQLRAGTDPVAGVQPTLAQVVQTPRAVQLERAARNNPISGPDIVAQDLQNSQARTQALQQHVLPQADELAARRTRAANFAPIMDAVNNAGFVDVGPLRFEAAGLAQRGNNAMTRSAAQKVLSFIDDNTAQVGANQGMIPVADLHTLQHDLGTIVKQANPEAINTSQALHELQPFKRAIVETIDSLAPGYKAGLQQYAKDSAPIGTSRTMSNLLSPTQATATDITGEPTLTVARLKSALSKDDRAPFHMTPQARQDLENVQASIQSRNAAQRSIGATGSPTDENRLNQLVSMGARHIGAGAGTAVGFGLGGPAGGFLGALTGHGADMLDRYAQNRIAASLGGLVMDPNASADALSRYLLLQGRRDAFNNALLPVGRYGGVAGLLASPSRSSGGQ